jgi:branched-chain amino acid transport system substrate-binding protein
MAINGARRLLAVTGAVVATGLMVAACSSSGGNAASSSGGAAPSSVGAAPSSVGSAPSSVGAAPSSGGAGGLGSPNAASGSPIVFGALTLESGPITFPETLQAEQAAVKYVNAYRGGIGGHPIKLISCVTDGQPSTSQRCANQLLDQKPVAILGAADIGAPGSIPVWQRGNLAYLGGVPFTPAEQNYANAVIFSSISSGDNAAASVYAAQTLKAKTAAVIYTSDTQGTSTGKIVADTMKAAGVSSVTRIALPPTSSDVSSAVATAVGKHPDVIYVDAPAACPNILNSLKQLGNTAKILGVDVCTSPKAIAGANGGADGLYFASPVLDPNADTPDAKLYLAAVKKYAPNLALDSLSTIGFQTVMNVEAALGKFTPAELTTAKIMAAFKTGKSMPNFMGHDYLCDGKQLVGAAALCNAYEQIRQVKGNKIAVASPNFVSAGKFYTP